MIFELLHNEWNSHQHQLYFSAGVLNCRPPRPLPFILKQSNQEIGMSSVCIAVSHQNVSAKQNNGLFSAFVDSRSILNLSRSSFIQSVWVMDEKERFDEELQVTGSTPPTFQRGNNSFSLINFYRVTCYELKSDINLTTIPLSSSRQSALSTLKV